MTEGTELRNQQIIRTVGEKETHKCMGKLEVNTIKQVEMKDKILRKDRRRTTQN